MNHTRWKRRIAALMDGGLPPDAAAEAHLAACAECATMRRELEETRSTLGGLRTLEPSDGDLETLRRLVMQTAPATRSKWAWFLWTPAAAALAAIVAVLIVLPRDSGPPPLVRIPVQAAQPVEIARAPVRLVRPARRAQSKVVIQSVREMAVAQTGATAQLVRIRTEDPRVAVYWVIESEGDQPR